MKKILITGGSGFIGSYLVKKFLLEKYKVLNLDKLSKVSQYLKIIDKNYSFLKCDLVNSKKVLKIVSNFKPDFIINAAAESHVDRSIITPKYFFDNNLTGTINLLNASLKLKKVFFIHISTDEVFGSLKIGEKKFSESSRYDPRSPYSASKAASDHAVRAYGETFGLNYIITNCSNNYGPYQFPEKLIPVIIKNCIDRKPIPIYGSGNNIRDWIHVIDHVDAIFKIIKKGKFNETYLIGSNNEINNLKLALGITDLFDKICGTQKTRNLIKFVKDRKGHDFRYAISNKKILKKINWRPKISFKKGLENTINFYIENHKKLQKIFPYG